MFSGALPTFAAPGVDVIGSSSAEFAAFILQDVAKHTKNSQRPPAFRLIE